MEELILKRIIEDLKEGKHSALVTLTEVNGSTPRDIGSLMLVWEDGSSYGSIGGGKIEFFVIQEAVEALAESKDREFDHSLTPNGDLEMQCGGSARGFIKIFKPKEKLLIAGGGHVGEKVLELGKFLRFNCEVIDDRDEYIDKPSLELADKLIIAPYQNVLDYTNIDEGTYVIIATKSHLTDVEFVRVVLKTKAKYIGVIGSKTKQIYLRKTLLEEGFTREDMSRLYGPVGLEIANQMPEEIAVSILAEVLLVKNEKELAHRRLRDKDF